MPYQPADRARFSRETTDDEIVLIVGEELPAWKRACDDPGADTVVLQQGAFGRSLPEVFLMHAAIRYAGLAGKTVMIAPYEGTKQPDR